jgi:hypothetical protein
MICPNLTGRRRARVSNHAHGPRTVTLPLPHEHLNQMVEVGQRQPAHKSRVQIADPYNDFELLPWLKEVVKASASLIRLLCVRVGRVLHKPSPMTVQGSRENLQNPQTHAVQERYHIRSNMVPIWIVNMAQYGETYSGNIYGEAWSSLMTFTHSHTYDRKSNLTQNDFGFWVLGERGGGAVKRARWLDWANTRRCRDWVKKSRMLQLFGDPTTLRNVVWRTPCESEIY